MTWQHGKTVTVISGKSAGCRGLVLSSAGTDVRVHMVEGPEANRMLELHASELQPHRALGPAHCQRTTCAPIPYVGCACRCVACTAANARLHQAGKDVGRLLDALPSLADLRETAAPVRVRRRRR